MKLGWANRQVNSTSVYICGMSDQSLSYSNFKNNVSKGIFTF
jgi:hypothetical protein